MNVIAMILAVAGASCSDPIYSINDLPCPIRYIDKQQGYFVGIENDEFTIGTALHDVKDPANDVPQVSGRVENCSSLTFKCRSIAELAFVIPKGTAESAEYSDGPRILIKRLANGGWHGSAMCSAITKTGCAWHGDASKLVEAYQYDVSSAGVLTSIKIQNWNDSGQLLSTQNLILMSEIGLRLN